MIRDITMSEDQSVKFKSKPFWVIMLLVAAIGIYFLLPQLGEFRQTMPVLRHSSWLWLVIAVAASGFTYWLAAFTQFVAGNSIGKLTDIILLQLSGSFMNHFLPFSLGGISITTDYYYKLGQRRSQAVIIATIPIIFGVITTLLMVAVISPVTLVQLSHGFQANPRTRLLTIAVGAGIVLALLALPLYKQWLKGVLKEAVIGLKSVRGFHQLTRVILGSAAITLSTSLALFSSIMAVHAHMALVAVFVLTVSSSLVSNLAPTPGGLGATEAVLVLGLSSAGLSLAQALASTLIFRFVTFWLPLLPGAIALRQLNRQTRLMKPI